MIGEDARVVRRIVVALGASRSATFDALSTASALAARLGAQLEGLFVEDVRLLRTAGLPFTTQLSLPSGIRRPLEPDAVEAELRAIAATAREALGAAAAAHGVSWSFRVARGHIWMELQQAAHTADLLVVGLDGRGLRSGRGKQGSSTTARRRSPGSREVAGSSPVLVAYDGSPGADRAVDVAAELVGRTTPLVLMVLAASPPEAQRIAARVLSRRPTREMQASWAGGESWQDLVRAVRGTAGPVVIPESISMTMEGGPEQLFEMIAAPLVIVR